jgi:succinate-semialdehyde dehydrogenase / glutarate-semialdehyde dehydrogenase
MNATLKPSPSPSATVAAAPRVTSGERFAVRNPRTGEVDYHFNAPSRAELDATAAALRRAQKQWRAAGMSYRVEVLRRWREALATRQLDITRALATDTGRYLIATSEAQSILGMIDRWTALAPQLAPEEEGRSRMAPSITYRSQYVPYGLVGVISPWNFPLSLCFIDAIPALLAGCSVLIKPSEVTPRFVEPVRASIDAVPELAAVLAVLPGARQSGEALVALSDVVCFTGSVTTGRLVAENAARHFIPAFLELGGKDPLVITASADLERATDVALRASCLATGQACQSLERVYVDRRVYAPFVEKLVAKAAKVQPNWPDVHAGTIGPFIFGKQAEIVAEQIADAKAKGARVLCGGEIEDHGGKWLRPTVVVDVTHDMKLMTEETFGPVMPVMPYDTTEQAIELANFGVYGLSAGVVAGTLQEAEAIGREIDAGGISLNDGSLTATMHEGEKHSFKLSGMGGSRMGPAGFTRFFRKKVLIRQEGAPTTMDMIAESHARPAAG